jgi:putative flippase GtrA
VSSTGTPSYQRLINGLPQTVRFIIAGGLAALITWIVRFPLSIFMPFPLAVAVATMIGMLFSFVAYKYFVFPGSARALGNQLRDFILVNIVGITIQTGVAVALDSTILPILGIVSHSEAIAHAIAIAVGAVSNFYGHRYVSFRHPDLGRDIQTQSDLLMAVASTPREEVTAASSETGKS